MTEAAYPVLSPPPSEERRVVGGEAPGEALWSAALPSPSFLEEEGSGLYSCSKKEPSGREVHLQAAY